MLTRRTFLRGLIAAPFVDKSGVLMPVKKLVGPEWTTDGIHPRPWVKIGEHCYAQYGFNDIDGPSAAEVYAERVKFWAAVRAKNPDIHVGPLIGLAA